MDSNYLGWSKSLAPAIMANSDRPELGERFTTSFCATDPKIAMQFSSVTFLSDNRSDLPKATVPCLTLQCTDDIIAPLEVGYYINKHMKENTLVLMKASGHCTHERPRRNHQGHKIIHQLGCSLHKWKHQSK